MQKAWKCILLLAVLLVPLILNGCSQTRDEIDYPAPIDEAHEKQSCADSGGEWRRFSTTCTNHCSYEREIKRAGKPLLCGQAITRGCYCGAGKCWTGAGCERI